MNAHKETSQKVVKLDSELRELGCPYSVHDPRALAWMRGREAGLAIARRAIGILNGGGDNG